MRAGLALVATSALVGGGLTALPAFGATVTSATFSGGPGTVKVGDTLFARTGAAITLDVVTSSDTQCVDIAGALTGHQQSAVARSTWSFTFTAPAGEGANSVIVSASPSFNTQQKCTGNTRTGQATFTLDNTGPVVTGSKSPAPNAAGWNKSDVAIAWSAADTGSGVGSSAPSPATDSVTTDTAGVTKTATATDRLGNAGTGSVTVKLDKTLPSINDTRSPAPNTAGWNNTDVAVGFTCSDALSGIKGCTGGGTVVVATEGANQSVPGTAVDNADNVNNSGVTGINIDKTAPSLSGAPTTAPNGNGWYNGDVSIAWTASDALSGLANGTPADSTITTEGTGLTASTSVSDKAGNTTNTQSKPVRIDRTAPTTSLSGTSNSWTNDDVTVQLAAEDNLSGVDSTSYSVDGGAAQTGSSFTLSSEGDHTVTYFSTDKAGNAEAAQTAHVRIDKSAPTIGHSFAPLSYQDGAWTNQDVTVTFDCADSGSGVESCTAPVTKTTEGEHSVTGTATDAAGNSATDTATVRIDKSAPTITGSADRAPNDAGWYDDDVTVSFQVGDRLSGVASAPGATVLGEGADQSVTGTATDAAGNSASDTVSGINVDKTAPILTASFTDGWHTGDVSVDWTCADVLSGVADEPADDVVTGEGDNLSSTATCADRAGNTVSETVTGIKIDRTAPSTTVSVPAPLESGWYAGPVDVTLTGYDALSGIDTTFYTVDGGDVQTYDGTFSFGVKGKHTLVYWSVDIAGNVEDSSANSLDIWIDGTPPTTKVINPISPASGWFVTSGIPVAFEATDGESGIEGTYYQIDGGETLVYGEPFTEDLSDGPHAITYWSEDIAGNEEAKQTVGIKIDTEKPTITASQNPEANAAGWNNTDVTVSFVCGDSLSEVATCTPDTDVTTEGMSQEVTGTAVDNAGNSTSTTVTVSIDKTAPTTPTFSGMADGTSYDFGKVPAAPTCDSSDALSGLVGCLVTTQDVNPAAVGTHTYTATATDVAGNTSTNTLTYTVNPYRWTGFYSPVDMGGVVNTVKGGSTVPLKFEVFNGSTEITDVAAVKVFRAKLVSCTGLSATTDSVETTSTGGTGLRYDTTGGQFIQNWKTPTGAGTCYSVSVTTNDGSTWSEAFFKIK